MAVLATKAIIFDCIGVLYGYNRSLLGGSELNTELVTLIRTSLKPHYKIGLLSNIDRQWINTFISKHKLEGMFDVVMVSGDEGFIKPDSQAYVRISELLTEEPERCLMIDDIYENFEGAVAIGMKSVLFSTNAQLKTELQKMHILVKI